MKLKNKIYSILSHYYRPHELYPIIKPLAHMLEKILGPAVFDYQGIKLMAGPVGLIDNYIIKGEDFNPYVGVALNQYLKDGGIFLDIGANHGMYSLLAAKNPLAKVFAFEPSPRELSRFWKNLQLNKNNNVSVLAYGLGEEEKIQEFVLSSNENPGKNSLPAICTQGTKINCHFSSIVKILSSDLFLQARVCKMDIEGQEMLVLNSLKNHMDLLKSCVFIVELNAPMLNSIGYKPEDIYQFFADAGFNYQYGNFENSCQWDEFFYHPDYNAPLNFNWEE